MNQLQLTALLEQLTAGTTSVRAVIDQLKHLPFEDLGIARLDHHRELRQGTPEVIFGQGKATDQLLTIVGALNNKQRNILVTRLDQDKGMALTDAFPAGTYDELSATFCLSHQSPKIASRGTILVVCAGTSDLPVAREAVVTARMLGHDVDELVDVGVAGIHRLFASTQQLHQAAVIIVVAGMEGALPSVIGGLVATPVIAVPTSVGYGASFSGIAALLGMLNSCAAGVTVVNIDNGFGAAFAAHRIVYHQPTNEKPSP